MHNTKNVKKFRKIFRGPYWFFPSNSYVNLYDEWEYSSTEQSKADVYFDTEPFNEITVIELVLGYRRLSAN